MLESPIRAHPRTVSSVRRRLALLVLLVAIAGGGVRMMTVHRPFNHQLANSWREADYVQIARNFDREGLNILYPRVDWRGDSPGYVEMEFPLTPWLAAVGYRVFGYHEQFLRILSAVFSVGGLLIFWAIARDALPPIAALIAFSAFALNPLLVRLSGAMQPEPLMMLFVLLAAYHALRFSRSARTRSLLFASASAAIAALAKAPGVTVGILLVVVCLRQYGWRAVIKPLVIVGAVIALAPPLLWYRWAGGFWVEYGNSLGLSNESHWLTIDQLLPPFFLIGNLKAELLLVWTPVGVLFFVASLRARQSTRLAFWWYVGVLLFYLAAAGTSGDEWAAYYHCISIPSACLLIAAGVQRVRHHPQIRRLWNWIGVAALVVTLIATTLVGLYRRDHDVELSRLRDCSAELVRYIPKDASIVVRGGRSVDEFDRPVAYNEPMLFAWLDRRGFNYAKDKLSLDTLTSIARRGGQFWIVRRDELDDSDDLGRLRDHYRRCGRCDCGYLTVFDLQSSADVESATDDPR